MEIFSWQAVLTILTVLSVIGCLAFSSVNPAAVLVSGMGVLLVSGVLRPEEALIGFANPGVITVGVLFIIVAGLRDTGAIYWLSKIFFGRSDNIIISQLRLMVATSVLSAFINNTPVVAMLTSAVQKWSKRVKVSVSKLLIPLSYASILGGTCTLIGTSTNLVVNGLVLTETEYQGIGLFELAWVGVPLVIVGLIYMLTVGRWLLPERLSAVEQLQNPREYIIEMLVDDDSSIIGKTIEEAGLRHLPNLYLIEIERNHRIIAAVSPREVLQAGDRLVFTGVIDSVVELRGINGLSVAEKQVFNLDIDQEERCLIEAVISQTSPVVGKTVKQADFRKLYSAVIIAISRGGERIKKKLGDIELMPGDTLLLEGSKRFHAQHRFSKDFLLVSQLENTAPIRYNRAPIALGILLLMVFCVSLGWIDMLRGSLTAAVAMVITRCVPRMDLMKHIDFQLLIAIAASFALGQAIQKTGVASSVADVFLNISHNDPLVALLMIYVMTVLFTELITNNAAAVLMFPIAYATSLSLGVDFMPFVITIMVAASASFMTPIGYQTNLMVYGPGGYHFLDYFKVGAPLSLLVGVVVLLIVPHVWSF